MNNNRYKKILNLFLIVSILLLTACTHESRNESSEIASTIARTNLLNTNLTKMLDQLVGQKSYHLTVSAVLNQSESIEETINLNPLKVTGKTKLQRSSNKEIIGKNPTFKKLYIKNKGRLPGLAKELQQNKIQKSMPGFVALGLFDRADLSKKSSLDCGVGCPRAARHD